MPHKMKRGKGVCAKPEGHAGECEPRDAGTFPDFAVDDERDDEPKVDPKGK